MTDEQIRTEEIRRHEEGYRKWLERQAQPLTPEEEAREEAHRLAKWKERYNYPLPL